MLARLEEAFERERTLRRRRQPRAAHAAGDPQDRARAGAARRAARPRSCDARAAVGGGGDRPARPARRGPARDRALRPGPAAGPPRRRRRRRGARRRRASASRAARARRGRARSPRADGLALDADRLRLEQALGNLRRQRAAPRRRHGRAGAPSARRRQRRAARARRRRRLSRRLRCRTRSSASPAPTRARGRGGAGLGLAIVAAIARAHGGSAGRRRGRRRRLDRAAGAPRARPGHADQRVVADDAGPDRRGRGRSSRG